MKYISDKGKIYDVKEDSLTYLDHGLTANIYFMEDKRLLKRYYAYTSKLVKLDEDIFTLLKELNNPNIVKIHEMLFDEPSLYKTGYIMDYIKPDNVDYLTNISSIFLEHIHEIEKVVDRLSKERVRVMDLKNSNVVITNNGMIIIDPDKYRIVDYDPTYANKDQILYLAYSILNFSKSPSKDSLDRLSLLKMKQAIEIDESMSITSQLSKKLTPSRKPIDIFKRAK